MTRLREWLGNMTNVQWKPTCHFGERVCIMLSSMAWSVEYDMKSVRLTESKQAGKASQQKMPFQPYSVWRSVFVIWCTTGCSSWSSGFHNVYPSSDIRLWMTQNLLKLNDNKTNILYLASPHWVKSLKTQALQMDASSITPNGSVKIKGYFWPIY